MRRVGVLGVVAAVAALALAPGCRGGDSPDDATGSDDLPVDRAEETSEPGDAADRLADAVAWVMESGRYRQTVTISWRGFPFSFFWPALILKLCTIEATCPFRIFPNTSRLNASLSSSLR